MDMEHGNRFEAVMAECGYSVRTTFWNDFSIADAFGEEAVRDTFKRAFGEWKTNTEYVTELVMVLNHKLWEHYDNGDFRIAIVYDELWRKADGYCCENLKGEDAEYYYRATD